MLLLIASFSLEAGIFDIFKKKDGKIELRVVTMFGGKDPAANAYKKALEEFQIQNPNVKIVDESRSADDVFKTKVRTDFASKNEPDITVFFTAKSGKPIVNSGRAMDFDGLLAEGKVCQGLSDAAVNGVRAEDGKLYAIPFAAFAEGMWINQDLFKKYDVEIPKTWEQLKKAIEVFKANKIVPITVPMSQEPHYMIETMILAAAGSVGHDSKLSKENNLGWELGLNTIKELYEMGAFPKDTFGMSEQQNRELFSNKKAAMMINGNWAYGTIKDAGNKDARMISLPIMPGGKGKYGSMLAGFGSGYYMSKASYEDPKKDQMALKLINFLTSEKQTLIFTKANGAIPSTKKQMTGLDPAVESVHKLVAVAPSVSFPIDMQISPAAWNIIKDNLSYIVLGKKTAKEVVEQAYKVENANK
ncbi:MAG: extracellular solute-binding protein, partial [Bacteroidota bacterium]|nr:extracellular solute-binding protein [Bacteroidota bacterium]